MSSIFYDHLIALDDVERKIKKIARTHDEKEELYGLIDEIVHHRVLGSILSRLPESHHKEFLDRLSRAPYDENLLAYLGERIADDVEEFIKQEIHSLSVELLLLIEEKTKPSLTSSKN
jgi:hypothetical protein